MSVGKKLNKKDLLSSNLATKHGYCTQRLSVAQVRDCGVRTYQTTPTYKRAATLQICSKTLIGATLC